MNHLCKNKIANMRQKAYNRISGTINEYIGSKAGNEIFVLVRDTMRGIFNPIYNDLYEKIERPNL